MEKEREEWERYGEREREIEREMKVEEGHMERGRWRERGRQRERAGVAFAACDDILCDHCLLVQLRAHARVYVCVSECV